MKIRLDKMLAHIGYGSRKDVKKIIRNGDVYVNETPCFDDDYKVDTDIDNVSVFDENVSYLEKVYIMLNKPKDYVSATFDFNKKTVIDLCEKYRKYKIFPVGRLDIDSVGLLILTNDGDLTHKLLSPNYHVDKKYFVNFDGLFKDDYYKCFEDGITLDDGYKTKPGKIELLSSNSANVIIHEGKFHQVKRMFEALDMKVTYLKRITFGPLSLDKSLQEGSYRLLNKDEIELLINSTK